MVKSDDMYPEFPKLECDTCHERFEVPRHWTPVPGYGNQIIIDWASGELLMKTHQQFHFDDLISGAENMLREDARRRGK